MTSLAILFAIVVLLIVGALALALSTIVRREATAGRLALGALLLVLATLVWIVGIQNPLPLP